MSDVKLTESEREALLVALYPAAGHRMGVLMYEGTIRAAVESILDARLADRDAAVEALRKLVDRGTGVDLMPTVNPAATDAAWWYDYMRGLDNQWRSRLRAALSGPADTHPADGTGT